MEMCQHFVKLHKNPYRIGTWQAIKRYRPSATNLATDGADARGFFGFFLKKLR
jgi:hypothetical protein